MAYSPSNPFALNGNYSGPQDWNSKAYNDYMTSFGNQGGALDFGSNGYQTDPYSNYMLGGNQGSPPGSDWNDTWGYGNASSGKLDSPAPASIPKSGWDYLAQYEPGGGSGAAANGGGNLTFDPSTYRSPNADFGLPGWQSLSGGGFDPWAGNPYAANMAKAMGNMNQLPQMTSDVTKQIADQMNQNAFVNFQYNKAQSDRDLKQQEIQAQIARNNAEIEQLKYRTDSEARLLELQIAQANQKLEFDKLALQTNDATARYQTDAGNNSKKYEVDALTGVKNKELDLTGQNNQSMLDLKLAEMNQQMQQFMAKLELDKQQTLPATASLDWEKQKWADQQKQRQDILALILKQGGFGGGGGSVGGGGGGFGGGSPGAPSGPGYGGGPYYGNGSGGSVLPSGALPESAIRSSISAIEGSPYGGVYGGPSGGMTQAQRSALNQDAGAMNFAYGQAAGNEALRKFIPANAKLGQDALAANRGLALGWGQFDAEKERNAAMQQQGRNSLYLQLLSALGE